MLHGITCTTYVGSAVWSGSEAGVVIGSSDSYIFDLDGSVCASVVQAKAKFVAHETEIENVGAAVNGGCRHENRPGSLDCILAGHAWPPERWTGSKGVGLLGKSFRNLHCVKGFFW